MSNLDLEKEHPELLPENLALPDYIEFVDLINVGGMGAIYECRHRISNKRMAVKVLQPKHLDNFVARKRFMKEAKVIESLDSKHIVKLLGYGVSSSQVPYIVMEYLEGEDLWNLLEKRNALSESRTLEIFIQATTGFGDAHNEGIIHRDLKPSNIMVLRQPSGKILVKIVDFGIAKYYKDEGGSSHRETPLTIEGGTIGTPLFMSPEQCMGKDLDVRSDIYSLGLVMYLCLTGDLPVEGESAVEVFGKHVNAEIDLEPVPPSMRVVIGRCLEKSPGDRYQSMAELQADLLRIQKDTAPQWRLTGKQKKSMRDSVGLFIGFSIGFAVCYLLLSLFH